MAIPPEPAIGEPLPLAIPLLACKLEMNCHRIAILDIYIINTT
jgi:hypothetical protein